MKYVVEFISKVKDDPSRNMLLTFGKPCCMCPASAEMESEE